MKGKRFTWTFVLVFGVLMPAVLFSVMGKLFEPSVQPSGKIFLPVILENGEVQSVELETYLMRVLLAQMPADFHTEALKAQAVAARTLAAREHLTGDKHPGGAVCTDQACCQAYCTLENWELPQKQVEAVRQAVRETSGQVLTYEGALIRAVYFPCSGGRTESAEDVFGEAAFYLQATDSPGEEKAPQYMTTVTFSTSNFAALLPEIPTGLPEQWVGDITYTEGNGVATIQIGQKTYSGTQVRQLLNLNSTAFAITILGDRVTVTTKGFGHRVGMSQYGAQAMAAKGSTYEQILAHYYCDTMLMQGWTLPSVVQNV